VGFLDHDPGHLQEVPPMETPEYDVVVFRPEEARWPSHLPANHEQESSRKLPLAFIPQTHSAITTGSERTVLRGATNDRSGGPGPDLNTVFD
jgi:hypothetical protein